MRELFEKVMAVFFIACVFAAVCCFIPAICGNYTAKVVTAVCCGLCMIPMFYFGCTCECKSDCVLDRDEEKW